METHTIEDTSATLIPPPFDLSCLISDENLQARLALDPQSRSTAYSLRYEGFRDYGYIDERPDGTFSDVFDSQDNMLTAIVSKDGRPVGTLRAGIKRLDESPSLPAMLVFPDEIKRAVAVLDHGGTPPNIVEIGRMARAPHAKNDVSIIHGIFRTGCYLALNFNPDIVLVAVRVNHLPIYRRLGFKRISGAKKFDGVNYKTVLLAYWPEKVGNRILYSPFLGEIEEEQKLTRRLIAGNTILIPPPIKPLFHF